MHMWIPDSLYKLLPFVYALVGAALIPIFGFSGPSMVSAILLLAASVLTTLWRYRPQDDAPKAMSPSVRDEWEKRKERRTESMPLDGFQ
ncbi:hypothetical protein [Aquabacterium sp.]|uniref:hypothetical protein n=1 Tax=Aquabacterium sp. TaxID=1872578 RepID=UPI00248A870C|nr:hypothetical protein [Aquabacterium sp.]MDI1259010.1 hypothetical protein [Aquabacterium sp.]